MEPKISIITLGVSDLKKATLFYKQGLDFPLQENSNENISFFSLKGTWLALYLREALAKDANAKSSQIQGFPGITLAHNAKTMEEVDLVLKQAEKAGAKIVKPARKADWGGYSGYFTDLDGYYWEVAFNPYFSIE